MTCEDCIYEPQCILRISYGMGDDGDKELTDMEKRCKPFKNKSDYVEVKHGAWIDKGWDGDRSWRIDGRGNCWHVYECSECGYQLKGCAATDFCSKCGAKMDGEKNEFKE